MFTGFQIHDFYLLSRFSTAKTKASKGNLTHNHDYVACILLELIEFNS